MLKASISRPPAAVLGSEKNLPLLPNESLYLRAARPGGGGGGGVGSGFVLARIEQLAGAFNCNGSWALRRPQENAENQNRTRQ